MSCRCGEISWTIGQKNIAPYTDTSSYCCAELRSAVSQLRAATADDNGQSWMSK